MPSHTEIFCSWITIKILQQYALWKSSQSLVVYSYFINVHNGINVTFVRGTNDTCTSFESKWTNLLHLTSWNEAAEGTLAFASWQHSCAKFWQLCLQSFPAVALLLDGPSVGVCPCFCQQLLPQWLLYFLSAQQICLLSITKHATGQQLLISY